jgi:hypothetical protein
MRCIYNFIYCLAILAGVVMLNSCKKNSFLTTGGGFNFSTDTLTFDTVFTTQGSVTKSILLKNENNKSVKFSNIKLAKGANSPFRLNIDGEPTKDINDVIVAPFDSVYIFVAVTVDPTATDNPFIVEDEIIATLNGQQKNLPLLAYGQNAIYINDSVLQGNIVWTPNKPIVIVNSALIDSNATLTIQAGTRIYMHANSKLFVKGVLKAIGTKTDSISFLGDRLDRDYFGGDIAGEWCGLHFLNKSHDNELAYCVIKNGGAPWKVYDEVAKEFGYLTGALIYMQPDDMPSTTPKLVMRNCFVGLSIQHGILAFNSSLDATNCCFYTCGAQNFYALDGGNYNFKYCTLANYGHKFLKHDKQPILALRNYIPNDDIALITGHLITTNFTNCIIDGNATEGDEVFIDNYPTWTNAHVFNNCIIKQITSIPNIDATLNASTKNLLNKSVDFEDAYKLDFKIKNSSSAKGNALVLPLVNTDIIDAPRNASPSIGCYE